MQTTFNGVWTSLYTLYILYKLYVATAYIITIFVESLNNNNVNY